MDSDELTQIRIEELYSSCTKKENPQSKLKYYIHKSRKHFHNSLFLILCKIQWIKVKVKYMSILPGFLSLGSESLQNRIITSDGQSNTIIGPIIRTTLFLNNMIFQSKSLSYRKFNYL